jgi:hypothetical protein
MRTRTASQIILGFLLVALTAALLGAFGPRQHDPKDILYWLKAVGTKDWSQEAAEKKPQAEFLYGLSLLRSNLTVMVGRVPWLSSIPFVGRRFFEQASWSINSSASQERIEAVYAWIKKAADQGYAPAKEAEKLFVERITASNATVRGSPNP